jgi:hypothetical protein
MSDYNRETGFLTLTLDRLHDFHRTADRLPEEEAPPIEFYIEKLKNIDYEVANVSNDKIDVKAPEHEIFELLSGQHIYL